MEELSGKQVEEIIDALNEGNFEASNDGVCMPDNGHATTITVEDRDGEPVSITADYVGDGPSNSAVNPKTNHTIKVIGYTFTGEESESYNVIDWELKSREYCMPSDDELLDKLIEALDDNRELVSFEDAMRADSVSDDWDEDELRDAIEEGLTHDSYVEIDGDYYGFDGDLEDFLKEFFGYDEDEEDEDDEYYDEDDEDEEVADDDDVVVEIEDDLGYKDKDESFYDKYDVYTWDEMVDILMESDIDI